MKRPAIFPLVMAVLALVVVLVTEVKPPPAATHSHLGYEINVLMANKTPYVGDNSKVAALIDAMPLPEGTVRGAVELQTAKPPYGIIINYALHDGAAPLTDGAISGDVFYRNAVVLFGLIDNVETINCVLADRTGEFDGASYAFPLTREAADEWLGGDVRGFAGSAAALKNLISRAVNLPLGTEGGAWAEAGVPDYEYDGLDPLEKLVYGTEIEMNIGGFGRGGFTVVAPKIHGSYKERDRLKVFVTTYHARYQIIGDTLTEEGAGIIPAAITYRKDDRGQYVLENYEQARDGAYWAPSIKGYCTMPVSGRKIPGLADRIMRHYSDYEDLHILLEQNLAQHLRKHGITAGWRGRMNRKPAVPAAWIRSKGTARARVT